jgi:SWI/SNF-related matrix-associated actin-dependent regulator 1 of chromatin subfamily A
VLTPRPYQIEGRDFLAGRQVAALFDEMRVGKTPQAILAAAKIGAGLILVICPAIAVEHWRREFARWYPALQDPAVMSFERALIQRPALLANTYDVVIVDECHFAGNPTAQRTQLIFKELAKRTKHFWALSGTPAPKHAGSLWPLLACAGVVKQDYDAFLRRYCRIDFLSQRPIGTKEEMIPELRALWQSIALRRTRKQVAPEVPDIDFNFLEIDPTQAPRVDIPAGLSDDALVERAESEDRVLVALAKVEPLLHEIEFALDNSLFKQTVVFGWHLEPLRKLVSCLNAMGFPATLLTGETSQVRRQEVQDLFRMGALDVIVGQIKACGTAIDLSAASHCYFLELDWVPGNNVQAANRLVSLEKGEKVTADVCTWPGSVDDRIQRVLVRRAAELNKLLA